MKSVLPVLSFDKLVCLIETIGDLLDKEGMHLTVIQRANIVMIWYCQKEAYEPRWGLVFYTPQGVPQISYHDLRILQSHINTLIEHTLEIKTR